MHESPPAIDHTCRNCGQLLTGAFCASCGQAARDGHAPTVAHFTHDLLHEFLHVDGTIFRTLKALFFQPGKLTEEYWAGRVASWVRPVRIFLVVVALHLLVSTGVGPLNYQLLAERSSNGELHLTFGSNVGRASGQTAAPGATPRTAVPEEERAKIFERFQHYYARIRYTSVLAFTLASWALYRRRQPNVVSHLIAGLHFYSFWYALALLLNVAARLNPIANALSFYSVVYLFLMLRRLFRESWYMGALKTLLLFGFLAVVELGLGIAAGKLASQ